MKATEARRKMLVKRRLGDIVARERERERDDELVRLSERTR